ncbi:peptidase M15 [Kineosporiaceae bacterium B12]|nr:peptidase M15 [Kineococcus rubinsiae]
MDGISGAMSRIAEIQALIASFQPTPTQRATVVTSTGSSTAAAPRTSTTSATSGLTFASTLSQSIATSTSASLTGTALTGSSLTGTASTATITKGLRTAAGVPLELAKYGNGEIPAAALSSIGQGSHTMWAPAAQAYQTLRAAAARDGVTIEATDSYRPYEQQVDLAQRKGLYSQGGLAAKPGTSEHGWGLSLDLDLNTKALTWMRAHAKDYGFSENVPREPWHWTFTT